MDKMMEVDGATSQSAAAGAAAAAVDTASEERKTSTTKNSNKSNGTTTTGKKTVAVIGCGPSGMFLCHALERRRQDLQQKLEVLQRELDVSSSLAPATTQSDIEKNQAMIMKIQSKLDSLPSITCFEQSDRPGGVWKSSSTSSSSSNSTQMYEALWCNGPKEHQEMFDYTWEEHFNTSADVAGDDHSQILNAPTYLPRIHVLDYMLKRVTRNCPDFFAKYVQFNTRVQNVKYDPCSKKFSVFILHCPDGQDGNNAKDSDDDDEEVKVEYENELSSSSSSSSSGSSSSSSGCSSSSSSSSSSAEHDDIMLFDHVVSATGANGVANIPNGIRKTFDKALCRWKKSVNRQRTTTHNNDSTIEINGGGTDETNEGTSLKLLEPLFVHSSKLINQHIDQVLQQKHVQQSMRGQGDERSRSHVVLIGGQDSAEDLALACVKWGFDKVTIIARQKRIDSPLTWTMNWPYSKVDVLLGYVVDAVEVTSGHDHYDDFDDAKSLCNRYHSKWTIHCVKFKKDIGMDLLTEIDGIATPQEKCNSPVVIQDIDLVISCTGYEKDWYLLDSSCYNMTESEFEQYFEDEDCMIFPEGWTMASNPVSDAISKSVGKSKAQNVRPSKSIYPGYIVSPYLYRDCVFIHNPQLFFMDEYEYETPQWALDVQAHLILKFLTGEKHIPTLSEMKSENYNGALLELNMPFVRYEMDTNYKTAVNRWLSKTTREVHYIDDSGNSCIRYDFPAEWSAAYIQYMKYLFQVLGRLMYEAEYPLQIISPDDVDTVNKLPQLNKLGLEIFHASQNSRNVMLCSKSGTTFRDIQLEQCSMITSVFTNKQPSPMTRKWLDIPDNELLDISKLS